jgi:thiol-disulfide isomerase/thioredoxin
MTKNNHDNGKMMTRTIVLLLSVLMLCAQNIHADENQADAVDFTLKQLRGDELSVSEFRGKWVVLNYWATWCAPCRKEIPELSELHVARDDVVVLGLAFEDTDIESFDEFLEEFHLTYPILLVDVYAPPEPFGAPKVLPTTIILDPAGIPVKTYLGPVTGHDIESFIDNS